MSESSIVSEVAIPTSSAIAEQSVVSCMTFGIRLGSDGLPLKAGGTAYDDYHMATVWDFERSVGGVHIGWRRDCEDHVNLGDLAHDEQVRQVAYLMREITLRRKKGLLRTQAESDAEAAAAAAAEPSPSSEAAP